jgi:hypothetical protein
MDNHRQVLSGRQRGLSLEQRTRADRCNNNGRATVFTPLLGTTPSVSFTSRRWKLGVKPERQMDINSFSLSSVASQKPPQQRPSIAINHLKSARAITIIPIIVIRSHRLLVRISSRSYHRIKSGVGYCGPTV